MSRYFDIRWTDLDFTKQQDIIDSLKEGIIEDMKQEVIEGRDLGNDFTKFPDTTWEESFCRVYAIDYTLWETEKEAKEFDWVFAIDQEAEKRAEERASKFYVEAEF